MQPRQAGPGTDDHTAAIVEPDTHQPGAVHGHPVADTHAERAGDHIARTERIRAGQPARIRELIPMLDVFCYTIALILLGLAAVLPANIPHRDRLAYAGLALWLLPTTVHTLQR